MPPTNTPAQVIQERNEQQPSAERKERLSLGDKEQKFVIKCASPIPT